MKFESGTTEIQKKTKMEDRLDDDENDTFSCSHQLENFKMIIWLFALNSIYIVIGMLSFEAFESQFEQQLCNDSSTALTEFVNTLTNHTVNEKYIVTKDQLRILVKEAEFYAEEGVPLGCTVLHDTFETSRSIKIILIK